MGDEPFAYVKRSFVPINLHSYSSRDRKGSGISLVTPMESNTFQDEAAKLFNKLPLLVRNCSDFSAFSKATFNYVTETEN